ncbi:MAG TPA: hypothetical protein VG734_12370 [Lacunisphaera sp.]|nr:hypothetical protein [Lacunisphaera sp.]
MPIHGLNSLPENVGLAFLGEEAWPPVMLQARQAEKLAAACNACGRPNSDVLRRRLGVVDGEPAESWQIDFPAHFTPQEASLYELPSAWIRERVRDNAWLNPKAKPDLRRALARVSRFLALPADAAVPDWRWIADDLLPDASLVVVARDEDFIHGVLGSGLFSVWWRAGRTRIGPVQRVESFPFPWPPATPLSALTSNQEEQRHAIARAVRAGEVERLNDVVLAAYGWTSGLTDRELLKKLTELNRARGG